MSTNPNFLGIIPRCASRVVTLWLLLAALLLLASSLYVSAISAAALKLSTMRKPFRFGVSSHGLLPSYSLQQEHGNDVEAASNKHVTESTTWRNKHTSASLTPPPQGEEPPIAMTTRRNKARTARNLEPKNVGIVHHGGSSKGRHTLSLLERSVYDVSGKHQQVEPDGIRCNANRIRSLNPDHRVEYTPPTFDDAFKTFKILHDHDDDDDDDDDNQNDEDDEVEYKLNWDHWLDSIDVLYQSCQGADEDWLFRRLHQDMVALVRKKRIRNHFPLTRMAQEVVDAVNILSRAAATLRELMKNAAREETLNLSRSPFLVMKKSLQEFSMIHRDQWSKLKGIYHVLFAKTLPADLAHKLLVDVNPKHVQKKKVLREIK